MHLPIRVAPEVAMAISEGRAVVALESTLIAHGLPWPENLETAVESESVVRTAGAVPATIVVVRGEVRVGLDPEELEWIAKAEPGSILKAGRRDLGVMVAQKKTAATTVSATMRIARSAGIMAMATGGLGGVHRGASESFDISTDLDELARAGGMLLVSAGVKSILDVPATLEMLETLGIAIVGYRTGEFPAFTTPSSGLKLEWRADTPAEAAEIVTAHRAMNLPGAILLAQPVDPSIGIDSVVMESAIARAMEESGHRGVKGKEITPFLLDAVRRATGGKSLIANRALIVANAGLAGLVAVEAARHGSRNLDS